MSMLDFFNDSLLVFTGAKGTGKTYMAYSLAPKDLKDRVYVHDAENSGSAFAKQFEELGAPLGYYLNLDDRWTEALPSNKDLLGRISRGDLPWANRREKDSMISYYKFVLDDIERNLTAGEYNVYIHDTVSRFEAGMAAWVDNNRDKSGWKMKAYGEMWWKGVYPLYRGILRALHQRGVKVVILTTHLRTPWEGKKPVRGAVEPRGKSVLYQLSQLHLWLVNEPANADGAPAGLVLKERMGRVSVDEDGDFVMTRCLPRRIPHCTWRDIEAYLEEPADLASPEPLEVPTSEEQRMMSPLLTDAQMELMILETKRDLLEEQRKSGPMAGAGTFELEDMSEDPKLVARKLAGAGVAAEQIAEQVDKPVPLVKRWIEE